MTLERAGVEAYYPMLRLVGYTPDLNLDLDEGVIRHRTGLDGKAVALVRKPREKTN